MGQVFKPAANSIAMVSLLLAAGAPVAIFLTGSQISRSPYNTKVGIPLDQPVPFSHKHHVKELGIDCRFCHHSVEEAAHASVPATEVCMTCHSQVWPNSPNLEPVRESWRTGTPLQWPKVNAVPDFVYFDHSIHVNRGISCNNCHGEVQEMHITSKGQAFKMSWCLECHRNPEEFLYAEKAGEGEKQLSPREQVFELYRKVARGEQLSDVEYKLANGLPQRAPNDKIHEGIKMVEERGVNVSQLADCYVCHH